MSRPHFPSQGPLDKLQIGAEPGGYDQAFLAGEEVPGGQSHREWWAVDRTAGPRVYMGGDGAPLAEPLSFYELFLCLPRQTIVNPLNMRPN